MASITIDPLVIKTVQQTGRYELRVYSADSFYNSAGLKIPAFPESSRIAYLKAACIYDGQAKTIIVPSVVIDSTTDAQDNARAKYSRAGIFKIGTGERVYTILENFYVPHDLGANLTWLTVQTANGGVKRFLDEGYYTKREVDVLIGGVAIDGGEFGSAYGGNGLDGGSL